MGQKISVHTPTKITINLVSALKASACNNGTLLQINAKNQLDALLNKFAKQSAEIKNNKKTVEPWELEFNPQRFNNTIFISGQRGAGKTTFLRSVLLEQAKSHNKIKPIAFIDPTLIEVNEHILIQIIAKIQASVSHALSNISDEHKRHEFQACMENMAEGLKLLGGCVNSKVQDPVFFLNKALKNAIGGQNLENKLNTLIDKAAEILNVDLLIIAFDDVDTNTNEAFNVLEVIRKYLTNPNLAILISGDLSLYSHIVQVQRARELSNGLFSTELMDLFSHNLLDITSHLEQQYLVKVLPVEQRIELKNLSNLVGNKIEINVSLQNKIKLDNNEEKNSLEIKEYIEFILRKSLKINSNGIDSYVKFFLEQPIRTVLQILKYIDEGNDNGHLNSRSLCIALRDSYIGDLRKENMPIEQLSNKDIHPHTIGMALFHLCQKNGELETGFYARPDGNSSSYNSSMFFLSSIISNYLNDEKDNFNQSTGRFLQLMLSGPAASTIFMNNVRGVTSLKLSHNDYINYIGLNKSQNAFSLAAHFSPLLSPSSIELGVLKMYRTIPPTFNHSKLKTVINDSIKSISGGVYGKLADVAMGGIENLNISAPSTSEINNIFQLAAKTISISSHSAIKNSIKSDYISIHCLLASISEILRNDNGNLQSTISKLSQMQTYGAPDFINNDDTSKDENISDVNNDVKVGDITNYISTWLSVNNNNESKGRLSSLLIGKVWTRIYYTLQTVSSNMSSKESRELLLSEAIERFIWVIINSFLIEEARYIFNVNDKIVKKLSNAKNVLSASTVLISNLKKVKSIIDVKEFQKELPLTYLFLTCPLFLPFLATTTSIPQAPVPQPPVPQPPVPQAPVPQAPELVSQELPVSGAKKSELYQEIKLIINNNNNNDEFLSQLEAIELHSSNAMVIISRFVIMGKFGATNAKS